MELNTDFSRRCLVHAGQLDWVGSPMPGVQRRMLDRIGGEVARATSIVRYTPNSHFSPHVHTGGEEFLVLEGVFQDEHGDFPAGTYIRNPPTSSHTPGSAEGCVIFVKLWQFDLQDRTQVRVFGNEIEPVINPATPGISVQPLFEDVREQVRLEHWQPGTSVCLQADGGLELLVLAGEASFDEESLTPQSWLRLPIGDSATLVAGAQGCRVWVKSGHLRYVTTPESAGAV